LTNFESERSLTALYDEPRLFEFWTGEVILLKLRWRVAGVDRPFGFAWLVEQLVMERKLFRDIAVAAFLISLLALLPPITFMIMIDRVLSNHSMSTLQILGIVLLAMIGFETIFGYLRRHLIWVATARIDARINLYVFDKLLNLPMSFFERMPTGMINAKIGQIWHIREFLTGELFGTMLDSVTLLVLVPVLFLLNWKLACLVIALASLFWYLCLFLPSLRRRHGACN
jgi:subfamily B ATP-binding cassette protein HlyB/CyaB